MHLRVGRRTGFIIPGQADSRDRPTPPGDRMYVRMTTLVFILEKYDEGVRIFEESVVPAARPAAPSP